MPEAIRVLAVDDNTDNLLTLQAVLSIALPSAEVTTARCGADGLRLARESDPDVVLLDIVMPGMDGYSVCRELKADEALGAIPVVFLTANKADQAGRVRALEAGAEGFLTKPFDEAELVAQVRAMAKIKQAAQRGRDERLVLARLVADRTAELERQLTERRRAEFALQCERDNLHSALSAAPVPLLVFDKDEQVVHANRAAVKLFGRPLEQLAGRRCGDVVGCAHAPEAGCGLGSSCPACILDRAVKEGLAGRPVHDRSLDAELVSPEGRRERRHLVLDQEPLTVDGRPGAVLAISDATEVRRIQREREDLRASLAQSDRLASMGMLAAGVAHEINNPLSYILYNLESLAEDLPEVGRFFRRFHELAKAQLGADGAAESLGYDPEVFDPATFEDSLERLRDAVSGAKRVQSIVKSLGSFSHVEPGETGLVSVPSCVEHALTMAANELKYRARVVLDLSPAPSVVASEGKLGQVFLNLLINAAHAIDEGHVGQNEVRIRTFSEGGWVVAEVSDTGHGIAPEHRARIFEPFFTTKPVGVGSGLGLSICRRIVVELGGEISFETELGRGTRFRVRLPTAPDGWAPAHEAAPGRAPQRARVRGRILVVDDELGVRATMERILKAEHDVVTSASGEEARALLERDRAFDLVFCDLMMPTMSGMELHCWLAGRDASLAEQLVFVTGGAFTPGASAYLAKAGNLRVEKPFDVQALRRMTNELVLAACAKRGAATTPG